MTSYRTVIAFKFPEAKINEFGTTQYVETIKYLPIDYLDSRSVNASSQIVTQPLQSGDTMADHMYRLPTTVDLSGKFSLNGRNWNNDSYMDLYNTNDRLTSIEWVFEYIKNNGSLCTITTVATEVDSADQFTYDEQGNLRGNINPSNTRFITRENMALTSISWKELQNTLEFSFKFNEVIMIDTEIYEIDPDDLDLPASIEQPAAKSLGTLLFEAGDLPKAITDTLYKNGYIKNDWLRAVAELGVATGIVTQVLIVCAVAAGVAAVAILATVKIGTAIITATSAVVPVGTIIAAAVVVTTAIIVGIVAIFNHNKKKQKEAVAFKLINGSPEQDLNRYQNFMDAVESAVNKAGSQITVYSFTSDDEQELCVPIGGNYYYITITKISESPYFKADIRVNGFNEDGDQIKNMRRNWAPVCNFMDLNENVNMWFKDESKEYQVYLVNPNLNDEINNDDGSKTVLRKKLSSYSIWICKGSIKEQINKIQKAINDTISAHNFAKK